MLNFDKFYGLFYKFKFNNLIIGMLTFLNFDKIKQLIHIVYF
jgi:hypothetical protein